LPEKSWQIDLEHLESLVDANTCAIIVRCYSCVVFFCVIERSGSYASWVWLVSNIRADPIAPHLLAVLDAAYNPLLCICVTPHFQVTNPSNPCGSNFSREHVAEIVAVAERCKLPIIADEIYADMVYSGADFTSISAIESNVPVLACGGLAKRWLVPGWRVGWVLVRDQNGVLAKEVKPALVNLSQLILGACTPVQAAIPAILKETSDEFYATNKANLKAAAELLNSALSQVPGLNPVMPEAAMYMMVGVDVDQMKDISNDSEFCQKLLQEQSVFCLPGAVFDYPNYFRIVITSPVEKLTAAMERITAFCKQHHK
jgi:tyrosine aminotransferase